MHHQFREIFVTLFSTVVFGVALIAQPDPQQMSGLPLPDAQLPNGTLTVRVIRGQLSNNVLNQPVELHHNDEVSIVNTDNEGRAVFVDLISGVDVYAVTELDGQRIESQHFPIPAEGGVRMMLVGATDPLADTLPVELRSLTFGGDSYIQVELGEESVELYYSLDIINTSSVPVEPIDPMNFNLPSGAVSATVLSGSMSGTVDEGGHVELPGPFQPGSTSLRVAYVLPYSGDTLVVAQSFPVNLETLLLSTEKWGEMDVVSSQVSRQIEMGPEETGMGTYIVGAGPLIPAGVAVSFELIGLPHHSTVPMVVTLSLTLVILLTGVGVVAMPVEPSGSPKYLHSIEVRKEHLFAELVKVERQHQAGKIGSTKYSTRRRELFAVLERVYREFDEERNVFLFDPAPSDSKGSAVIGH